VFNKNRKKTRYLWVYSAGDDWTISWHEKMIKRRRDRGYDVIGFCNTPLSLQRGWLPFPELDRRWREGDPNLLEMYSSLLEYVQNSDVLILYNGANLHPEFVKLLHILKVYTAGDDPESTDILTKPIARFFNIHLINNIACLQMYRDWGLKQVHFWPLGSLNTIDELADINEENIRDLTKRTTPIIFCGGYTSWRYERMQKLIKSFPSAFVAGQGMPQGYISSDELAKRYRGSQIGWNLHNSTGPINFRTYDLPSYGVMQICDNKKTLGEIYQLNKEVIGFDTIDECIELTKYYQDSPEEQRDIALAGWQRWEKDYHPDQVWLRLTNIVDTYYSNFYEKQDPTDIQEIKKFLIKKQNSCFFTHHIPFRISKVISNFFRVR
jgi:hypothetical protein